MDKKLNAIHELDPHKINNLPYSTDFYNTIKHKHTL